MEFWPLIPFGFIIGLIGGLLGIGGGIFVVPVLHLCFKMPMQQAAAISLSAIVASSMACSISDIRRSMINIRLSKALEIPSVLGAIIGVHVAGALSAGIIKTAFACAAFLMAFGMLKKNFVVPSARQAARLGKRGLFSARFRDLGRTSRYDVKNLGVAVPLASFAGFLSSTLGIGGGIVNVPLMTGVCKIPVKAACATSGYKLGLTACAGGILYFAQGFVLAQAAIPLALGVMAGAYLAMKLLIKIKPSYIEVMFSCLMLFIAVKMLASL